MRATVLLRSAFLKEGVFLFSTGTTIRLSDIPPGGVWIRLLGTLHGKSVYRVTVQTRFQGSYDLAVNVNHDMTEDQVQEEIFAEAFQDRRFDTLRSRLGLEHHLFTRERVNALASLGCFLLHDAQLQKSGDRKQGRQGTGQQAGIVRIFGINGAGVSRCQTEVEVQEPAAGSAVMQAIVF